jgi:hypothetical protein
VTLQTQPDERLIELMDAQKQRQRGESNVVTPVIYMAKRIDPDRCDRDPADQISLR